MRIPTWRLLLTGGAIAILMVAGLQLVTASTEQATTDAMAADLLAATTTDAGDTAQSQPALGARGARWLRIARHLVHAEVTVTGKDDELIVLALDHGTVDAIGGGTLTIAEAGGTKQTVSVDDKTIVYVGRKDGELADVKVGAEVFVQSRVDGSTLAKRILVLPPKATGD